MSDVLYDEWDRAYNEGYEVGYEAGEEAGRISAWNGDWSIRRLMNETRYRAVEECIAKLSAIQGKL